MSVPPAPPLLLASTSPQRRAILKQLHIPFEVVPPRFEERDEPGRDPVELVREHARGKAQSVTTEPDERPILGVDTTVVLDGEMFAKPADPGEAEAMLERLSGATHEAVSGLCLLTPGWVALEYDVTRVTFRELRAGGYAIQGVGATLVERIEGDYLNVVGLPAALLVRLLATRFPGVYNIG